MKEFVISMLLFWGPLAIWAVAVSIYRWVRK